LLPDTKYHNFPIYGNEQPNKKRLQTIIQNDLFLQTIKQGNDRGQEGIIDLLQSHSDIFIRLSEFLKMHFFQFLRSNIILIHSMTFVLNNLNNHMYFLSILPIFKQ
jgi:hypothetical protein